MSEPREFSWTRSRLVRAAVLVPFLLLALRYWPVAPSLTNGDYAQYLLHARALAEGRPYTDIGYIYTELYPQLGPRAYPPGLPLTLLPLFALFGENLFVMKLVILGFALLFLWTAGRYFFELEDPAAGLAVALLCGLSPPLLLASSRVATDLSFCVLVWVVMLQADRAGPWTPWRLSVMSAAGAGALLYRTAGVALIGTLFLIVLVRHRERTWMPLIPAGVWTGVWLGSNALLPVASSYADQVTWNPWELARMAVSNVNFYRTGVFESQFYPFSGNVRNDAYHVLSVTIMAVGLAVWALRRRDRFLMVFSIVYVVMILLFRGSAGRYLWPLYPLMVFGLIQGTRTLARLARPGWPPARLAAVSVLPWVLMAALATGYDVARPRPVRTVGAPPARELFEFLREAGRTTPMRIVFAKPRVLTWETGIPAMPAFDAPPLEVLEEMRAKKIDHVVVSKVPLSPRRDAALRRAVESAPGAFRLVFENSDFAVYHFSSDAAPEVAPPPASTRYTVVPGDTEGHAPSRLASYSTR